MRDAAAPLESLAPALHAIEGRLQVMGVGALTYYCDARGAGAPVVLIHSINAAASAHEMQPLFEGLRGHRPVFALDLPGFGRSERSRRRYTPALYAQAIERFIVDVVSPNGDPVDAVALSLSSEFLARVALRSPSLFKSLKLLSPTGFSLRHKYGGLAHALLPGAIQLPIVSDALFRLIRSEPSVRYFLQKAFVGKPDESLVQYALRTSSVEGAKYASLTFLTGVLFTPDADRELYAKLRVPTEVLYDRDPYTGFDRLEAVCRENAFVIPMRISPSRGMAHYEKTAEVIDRIGL